MRQSAIRNGSIWPKPTFMRVSKSVSSPSSPTKRTCRALCAHAPPLMILEKATRHRCIPLSPGERCPVPSQPTARSVDCCGPQIGRALPTSTWRQSPTPIEEASSLVFAHAQNRAGDYRVGISIWIGKLNDIDRHAVPPEIPHDGTRHIRSRGGEDQVLRRLNLDGIESLRLLQVAWTVGNITARRLLEAVLELLCGDLRTSRIRGRIEPDAQ
jgi:hypothetical protein